MNRFLNWLPTTVVAAVVFAAFYALYALRLPEGWPRFVAVGVLVVAVVALWVAAVHAYNHPKK